MPLFLKALITPKIQGGFQRVLVLLTPPHHAMCVDIKKLKQGQHASQDQAVKAAIIFSNSILGELSRRPKCVIAELRSFKFSWEEFKLESRTLVRI